MNDYLININGKITPGDQAFISVFDRGFLYGDSVYETTRTFNKKPFQIDRHLDRLFLSSEKISLTPTLSKENILEETLKTIAASPFQDLLLRIVLTRGTNSTLGLDPGLSTSNNLVIFVKKIEQNPSWWYEKGVNVIYYEKTIEASGSLPKTGNYQENILAYQKAKKANAFDALMINTFKKVTEGTTSNIWVFKNKMLLTPPLADGVLDGLTRKTLFEMAEKKCLPFPLLEKSLTVEDFDACDECFMTSTTRNIVPITQINSNPIKNGLPGKYTLQLLGLYLEYVM